MKKGRVLIISGPSGSGKTTLQKKLLQDPFFKKVLARSISVTTRSPRKGEAHGKDYIFITKKMFDYKKRAGHFLESMKVFQHFYGTPKKNVMDLLEKGKNVLLCIDVQGAKVVSREFPDALKIFVKTPSDRVLLDRLKKRGTETAETLRIRFCIAKEELKEARHYEHIIINAQLNKAYQRLKEILRTQL